MSQPIDIRPDHLQIVQDILNAHVPNHAVWVFGSRAKWATKDSSDLDLCIKGEKPLSPETLAHLRDAFSESNQPYKVGVVDWFGISDSFREIVKREKVALLKMEWKKINLSEIADIVMGQSPSGVNCNQNGVGVPLLNGPTEFGLSHPDAVQYTTDAKKIAQENDLLFCVRGSTTGRMNWADKTYAIGRGLAAIRHKKGSEYRHYLRGVIDINLPNLLAAATGSTFPNVSKDQIMEMKIYALSLQQQKLISDILSALDKKIEINHQMNVTLETTARTLFKSWFIDFDPVRAKMAGRQLEGLTPDITSLFPDMLIDSPLGLIPKGWEITKLMNILEQSKVTLNPTKFPTEEFIYYNLPAYDKDRNPVEELGTSIKSNKMLISSEYVLLSKLNPEISRVWMPEENKSFRSICSTEFLAYKPLKNFTREYLYCLFTEPAFRSLLKGMVTGTSKSHQRVQPKAILELNCVIPTSKILKVFGDIATPLLGTVRKNIQQSLLLSKLRNTLLPKLISGELRVNNPQEAEND